MFAFLRALAAVVRSNRKGFVFFCIVVFVVTVAGAILSLQISSASWFCSSCHYMDPYIEAWKTSKHSDVPCAKCHYPVGDFIGELNAKIAASAYTIKYLTGTFTGAPQAEVHDANCLQEGCHEARLLDEKEGGEPVVYKENIKFSHKEHLKELRRGKQLRCTTCHSQIVQGEHIDVTESVCFTCHFKDAELGKDTADCNLCHGAPEKVVVHEGLEFDHQPYQDRNVPCQECHKMVVSGQGKVAEHMCVTCHMAPLDKKKAEDPVFVHHNHVTEHKVECFVCHDPIEHGKVALSHAFESPCESCHGAAVHDLQKKMLAGMGGKGTEDCPSTMYQTKIGCNACHAKPDSDQAIAMGAMPSAQAKLCQECHGKGYDGMFEGWEWAFEGYTERLGKLRERAKQKLTAAADDLEDFELKEAKEYFAKADADLTFVERGKGAHNVPYAKKMLFAAQEALEECLYAVDEDYVSTNALGMLEYHLQPGCLYACHTGIERVVKAKYEDREFEHAKHVTEHEIKCVQCHADERDYRKAHGKVEMDLKSPLCQDCHEKEKDKLQEKAKTEPAE